MQLPLFPTVWSTEKNELLKKKRGVSFGEVFIAMQQNQIITVEPHPNQARYPGQFRMFVVIRAYVYVVPFVVDRKRKHLFLKTIIPSRALTKKYLQN